MHLIDAYTALRFCLGGHLLLLNRQRKELPVYTHLFIGQDDAAMLFLTYGPKPLEPGQSGVVTGSTLKDHFGQFGATSLDELGCSLEKDRKQGNYVLKFRDWLPGVPQQLLDNEVDIWGAEIVRPRSSVTRAAGGYYWNDLVDVGAVVEPIVPEGSGQNAQNIRVWGPTLDLVQEYHERLCTGAWHPDENFE